jgi:hypothetical protein
MSETINLAEKLALFSDHWSPRTIARLNDHDVIVVKVQGEFVWHKHGVGFATGLWTSTETSYFFWYGTLRRSVAARFARSPRRS